MSISSWENRRDSLKSVMNCNICNSENVKRIGCKNSFDIARCNKCRTLFAVKIEDSSDYFDYSTYYDEGNLTVPNFVNDSYRKTIGEFESHRGNNRFLDVGCGAGTLLKIANEMNWDTTGVEVSKPAAEHLKSLGLNIFEGTLEEAHFPDDHFDAITCTEVIEHVTDPKRLMKEIARILNPKGVLWMTTPHSNGLSGKLLGAKWSVVAPPEHLNLFSKNSLRDCLDDAGFKNFEIALTGFNPIEAIQVLRRGETDGTDENGDNTNADISDQDAISGTERVKGSYKLNQWFVAGKYKQHLKTLINLLLSKTGSGDTIKIKATFD